MSRQLSFYLLPACVRELVHECLEVHGGGLCRPDMTPMVDWDLTSHKRFACWSDVHRGLLDATPTPINETFHPVIEISPGMLNADRELIRGRLYFTTSYYADNGTLVRKDARFLSWAEHWLRSFRKRMTRRDYGWTNAATLSWLESGSGVFHDGLGIVAPQPS